MDTVALMMSLETAKEPFGDVGVPYSVLSAGIFKVSLGDGSTRDSMCLHVDLNGYSQYMTMTLPEDYEEDLDFSLIMHSVKRELIRRAR